MHVIVDSATPVQSATIAATVTTAMATSAERVNAALESTKRFVSKIAAIVCANRISPARDAKRVQLVFTTSHSVWVSFKTLKFNLKFYLIKIKPVSVTWTVLSTKTARSTASSSVHAKKAVVALCATNVLRDTTSN